MLYKLRNQLLRISLLLLFLVMTVSFVMIYSITWMNVQSEQEQMFKDVLFELETNLLSPIAVQEESSWSDEMSIVTGTITSHNNSFVLFITDDSILDHGWSLQGFPEEFYEYVFTQTWLQQHSQGLLHLDQQDWKYALISQGYTGDLDEFTYNHMQLLVFVDVTMQQARLQQLRITFAIAAPITVLLLTVISFLLSNRAIRPIESSWSKQRQFLADASHELKTPLASITANINAIELDAPELYQDQKRWFLHIEQDIVRMTKLVNDMLYLSKTEDVREEFHHIDMSHLCEMCLTQMEAQLFDERLTITSELEHHLYVRANKDRLQQVLFILLDNARKYSVSQSIIQVSLRQLHGRVIFAISNTTDQLDAKDLPYLFDRFYRSDVSRNNENGGYGLGLAIAKAIIEEMDGKIWMSLEHNVVTCTISIPPDHKVM